MVPDRNLALVMCLLFSQRLDFGISDCGFYTPIVRSNCPLKSIESAEFYENGFSPALPFMITLWPHDIRLCCINFNTDNCWLLTKTTSNCKEKSPNCNLQEIRNYRLAGSQDKNSHNYCFKSTFHWQCSAYFRQFFAAPFQVFMRGWSLFSGFCLQRPL